MLNAVQYKNIYGIRYHKFSAMSENSLILTYRFLKP